MSMKLWPHWPKPWLFFIAIWLTWLVSMKNPWKTTPEPLIISVVVEIGHAIPAIITVVEEIIRYFLRGP